MLDENELTNEALKNELRDLVKPARAVFVNAKLEEEMTGMSLDEKMEDFLNEVMAWKKMPWASS